MWWIIGFIVIVGVIVVVMNRRGSTGASRADDLPSEPATGHLRRRATSAAAAAAATRAAAASDPPESRLHRSRRSGACGPYSRWAGRHPTGPHQGDRMYIGLGIVLIVDRRDPGLRAEHRHPGRRRRHPRLHPHARRRARDRAAPSHDPAPPGRLHDHPREPGRPGQRLARRPHGRRPPLTTRTPRMPDGPPREGVGRSASGQAQNADSGTSMRSVVGGLGDGALGGEAGQDLPGEELRGRDLAL